MEDKPGIYDKNGHYYPPGSRMPERRRFGGGFKVMVIAVIVLVAISGPIVLFFTFNNPNLMINAELVDTYSVEQNTNASQLDFNIVNLSGDIEIETDSSLDYDVEIETMVYSTDEHSMHYQMFEWDVSEIGNTFVMEFIYNENTNFDDEQLVFDHQILINSRFNISNLNIESTTGEIDVDIASTPEVSQLYLETTTGSADFRYTDGIIYGDSLMTTTTGSVNLNLNSLKIYGDILVDVTTSGVDFEFYDLEFMQDTRIDVDVTTGGIEFDWSQLTNMTYTLDIFLDTTTGSIDGQMEIRSDISLNFDADVTTGSVDVPNDTTGSTGTMNFYCESTTGSIEITQ